VSDMSQAPLQSAESKVWGERPARGGYFSFFTASLGQMLLMMMRQNRLILVSIITMLPVIIPLAIAFLSKSAFADEGNVIFVRLMEEAHINTLAPLLALFFASMLVGEDVEMQTLPYVLTRPQPRSGAGTGTRCKTGARGACQGQREPCNRLGRD